MDGANVASKSSCLEAQVFLLHTPVTGIISKHLHNTIEYVEHTAGNYSGKGYLPQSGTTPFTNGSCSSVKL
jgi:hypothetical protein